MTKTKEEIDFTKQINETSTGLARLCIENMLEHFDLFDGSNGDTEEELKELDKKRMNYAIDLLAIISQTSIPADYASFSLQKVKAGVEVVGYYLDQAIKSWDKEILSRTIGVKSPLDNKFDKEFATVKDVMNTLIELRKKTGGQDEYMVAKEK